MHFLTEQFLFFALAFGAVFFFLGRVAQKLALLVASFYFCGSQNWIFTALLSASIVCNYFFSLGVAGSERLRRPAMWLGITANVGFLGVFKYFNFFSTSFGDGLAMLGVHYDAPTLNLVLPLGISFYTLQAISYLVDLREAKLTRAGFFDLAVYLSFWPKFVAGPIIRATRFMPQLAMRRQFRWANLYLGLESVVYGLFLKTVLSDYLAPHVNRIYTAPEAYEGANSLVAATFYSFQIYGDFAGYSLVVIGIARIFGYSCAPNFRRPNFATSFSDFWQRWHTSLSSWLGEYVYRRLPRSPRARPVPPETAGSLGTSLNGRGSGKVKKVSEWRVSRNQLTTLLVSGLWHGAAWTFVTWGAFHGFMLILQRQTWRVLKPLYARAPILTQISRPLQILIVLLLVAVSRVFFRAKDLGDAWIVLTHIFRGPYDWTTLDSKATLAIGGAVIVAVMLVEASVEVGFWRWLIARRRYLRAAAALVVLLVTLVIGEFAGGRFIYVRF